jgi:hypothetical protein
VIVYGVCVASLLEETEARLLMEQGLENLRFILTISILYTCLRIEYIYLFLLYVNSENISFPLLTVIPIPFSAIYLLILKLFGYLYTVK